MYVNNNVNFTLISVYKERIFMLTLRQHNPLHKQYFTTGLVTQKLLM